MANNKPILDTPVASAAPAGPSMPASSTGPSMPAGENQPNASAEMFVANGVRLIHDTKISDTFIDKIIAAQDPVEPIADFTLFIVERLEESAGGSGIKLDPGTLAQVANVLMGEIMQMSEAAGMKPLSEEDRYRSYSIAVSKYIDSAVKSGKLTKEQLAQLGAQAKQSPQGKEMINKMNATGQGAGQQVAPAAAPAAAPTGPRQPGKAIMGV